MSQPVPLHPAASPALERARSRLQLAREYLCAGCKRDCERRLTPFGQTPRSCRQG